MMGKRNTQAAIYDLLSCIGVTLNYKGYNQTACAVSLCLKEPERLQLVTKLLYPKVAKRHQTSWKAVERNIRTVDGVIWRENRFLLEELVRKPLVRKPRNAQLLAILAF
ncbi:MAG: sporulation initiation factor Spo0A C-terminal domain-containing protein [Ruminococcus flavefaciens]|nr:sporulation initiation factor Spo0A C-terminal domain-containing protein [Ruminococcus flavefaciens]